MFLFQQTYANEILKHTKMENYKRIATPVDTNSKLSASADNPGVDTSHYRQLTGAFQYLTFTRPYIAYAVQQNFIFMHTPRGPHLNALKLITWYLKGIMHPNYIYTLLHHLNLLLTLMLIGEGALIVNVPHLNIMSLSDNLISWSVM